MGIDVEVMLLDECDFGLLEGRDFCVAAGGYAMVRGKYVHRLVMRAERGQIVDHINGNKLDNRRCNLRFVTHAQNIQNSGKKYGHAPVQSQFRGVNWDAERGKWRVSYKGKHVGRFDSEESAAIAYNAAAMTDEGSLVPLNLAGGQS